MTVQYTNRRSITYYLHAGKTKTGKPKYHFSMKKEGNLVGKIPAGYEIFEHPANAQVFLRKTQPKVITDIEKRLIGKSLKKIKVSKRYLFDIKGKVITIFESDQDIDALRELFTGMSNQDSLNNQFTVDSAIDNAITYFPVMRFILDDKIMRAFVAERFCFIGSIDDWIYIGGPDSLDKLLKKYLKHIGEESFFELYGLNGEIS